MYILPEIVLITSGAVGIVTDIVLLILLACRRTTTHVYILYMTALSLLAQIVSPTFHHLYTSDLYKEYDVTEILTLTFIILLIGGVVIVYLLFFMDYFKWISSQKYIVMIVHFATMTLTLLLYYFVAERYMRHAFIIVAVLVLLLLALVLTLILYREVDWLTKRKEADDESDFRNGFVLLYVSVRVISLIVYVLEHFAGIIILGYPGLGFFTIGLYQMFSVFYLIYFIKTDHTLKNNLLGLFKMCSITRKVRFQNLPSDNGRLLNQDIVV